MYDMYSAQGEGPNVQYVQCPKEGSQGTICTVPKGGGSQCTICTVPKRGGSQCTISTVPKGRVPMYDM